MSGEAWPGGRCSDSGKRMVRAAKLRRPRRWWMGWGVGERGVSRLSPGFLVLPKVRRRRNEKKMDIAIVGMQSWRCFSFLPVDKSSEKVDKLVCSSEERSG